LWITICWNTIRNYTISIIFYTNDITQKREKTYGTSKLIEGVWNETDEIIIIDDILTTGESIIESLPHFNKFKIKKIIVIVDRKEGGSNKLRNMGYNVESLYTIDDFFIKDESTP
jgi:uridine monophosphate synthetase